MSKKYCDKHNYLPLYLFYKGPRFIFKMWGTLCHLWQSIMKHKYHCFKGCICILNLVSVENGEENALNWSWEYHSRL